ncbi:MAG: hypothetical protein ACKPH3_16785, partial [Dolichospermum sp.]
MVRYIRVVNDYLHPYIRARSILYDTSGSAIGVQVVGDYAYVADHDSGLQIIDISNP